MNCHNEATDDDYHAEHSHSHDHSHDHDHSHGHGHSHDHSHDAEPDTGMADSLFGKVLLEHVRCLNESTPDAIQQVFKPWHQRLDTQYFVESCEDDPELLVYVPFSGMIKLKSIILWGGSSDSAPSEMRVFANRDDLDFDNVREATATQEFSLARGARQPVEYSVRTAKFGSVRTLTLLFPRNFFDDDETASTVYFLAFRGEWMQMKDTPVVAVYELKPNFSDHKTPANESLGHNSIS